MAAWAIFGAVVTSMVLWRVERLRGRSGSRLAETPYTCGFAACGSKELFLVATVHISPRAPRDVEETMRIVHPDVTMIELDEERLDRMRDLETQRARVPAAEAQLQQISVSESGHEPVTLQAQRALWNGEHGGEVISASLSFDEADAYGLSVSEAARGKVALVRRGGPDGRFAPFALKAHHAARSGAQAVLVVNHENQLPAKRLGGGSLSAELRVALRTWSCGFPSVPLLLVPKDEGEQLIERCCRAHEARSEASQQGPHAEFQVMQDSYPRRTLRRRIVQACALLLSGIGILYGVIECFAVEVGAEFTRAEEAASRRGIPCVCIDTDMNGFWSRIAAALVPTPRNVARAAAAWLAFPRVLAGILFPPFDNVDTLGSTLLHGASLPLRTWVAFFIAGQAASLVTSELLQSFSYLGEQGMEGAGAVGEQDRAASQSLIMLLTEMFLMPQVFEAVAASRDEVMYQSIVAKSREHAASRMMVVVGAAHANGILQRARTRGL